MRVYIDLVSEILAKGSITPQRATVKGAPVKMRLLPGMAIRHDLREGFPLLTTKRIPFHLVAAETDFFLKGETRKEGLHARGNCRIWDPWQAPGQDDPMELGPIYGDQWRHWKAYERESPGGMDLTYHETEIDQLAILLETLKTNPYDRRTLVSAWNVADLGKMALPPCHVLWQTVTTIDAIGRHVLNLCMTMRSADVMIGVPFNVASYALILLLVAKHVGMIPGILTVNLNNAHIYENHVDAAYEQIHRETRILPTVTIPDRADGKPFDLMQWDYTQVEVKGYDPHPAIKMEVAV